MAVQTKVGVQLIGTAPEMQLACEVAEMVYFEHGADLTITSARDGKHAKASRHYIGYALDFRTHHGVLPNDRVRYAVAKEIQRLLGPSYYVAYERRKYHIHAQYNGEPVQ